MLGGEDLARNWLAENTAGDTSGLNQVLLLGEPIVFPLDDDGSIQISASDGRNCYNINRLAAPKIKEQTRAELAQLFRYMEFDSFAAESFAARIQDWVDGDTIPEQGGAEDLTYTSQKPPYHAANTMMVDISELRAVEGIGQEQYLKMKPLLCAVPDVKMNKINLNTLEPEQWPLLALLLGNTDAVSPEAQKAAQAVIALRPLAGYGSTGAVWALPIIEDLKLKGAGKNMTAVKTDMVDLLIQVQIGQEIGQDGVGQVRRQMVRFALGGDMGSETGVELIARRSAF
ncbi:MAG: type II secretion system minor pseudopilin GspK [Robiginitomaculum sp.]|nr:type II secretion system minor pseudopilin GspK [Robiginitomaculum sp.]